MEKFSHAMRAALELTTSRVDTSVSTASQGTLLSSSSSFSARPSVANEDAAAERIVWAEVAAVFWRIASRQQTHLLFYVTLDAAQALRRLSDGLLDYIQARFLGFSPNAPPRDVMDCASFLDADHILFFLDAFCSLRSCVSMMGGDEASGRQLHDHVCSLLVRQRHLHWMTCVFRAFCEEARRVSEEESRISDADAAAVHSVLQCLLHCCMTNTDCARELIYTEPKPLVASLLFGVRLRIATASLIRPLLGDECSRRHAGASLLPSSSAVGGLKKRADLARHIATGRTNIYDKMSREALRVVVSAVERAAAHDSPDIVIALCLVIDLSSRGIMQTPEEGEEGEEERKRKREEAKVPMSVQIAMYENVLMAWNALCRLLRSNNGVTSARNLEARREVILQQLVKHDLASSVQRILYHCPAIVSCEPAFFWAIRNLCIPPLACGGKLTSGGTPLDGSTSSAPGNDGFRDGGHHSHALSLGSFSRKIHGRHSLPQESIPRRRSNFTRLLWTDFWDCGLCNDHGTAYILKELSFVGFAFGSDGLVHVQEPRETSDAVSDQRPSPPVELELGDDREEWWYDNRIYTELVRSQTRVLMNVFSDSTTHSLLRLSLCKLLTQIIMHSCCAFWALEGRLLMCLFLKVFREQEEHLLSPPVTTPSLSQVEDEECLGESMSNTNEVSGENGLGCRCGDEGALRALLVQQIVAALWHVYCVLHMPPLSDEVVDLVELPFLLLRWRGKVKEKMTAFTSAEVSKTLEALFEPLLWMWYKALLNNDDEDNYNRSCELFMGVFTDLLNFGEVPVEAAEAPGASTNAVLATPLSSSVYLSGTPKTTAQSGDGSTFFQELETPQFLFDDTIELLRNIFYFLLQHDRRFLSVQMLDVLIAYLLVNDTRLSELGRKCIVSSLNFGDVYVKYAEVISGANDLLLVRLLPLFLVDLLSCALSTDAKHERRIWLFQHGCVDAVITVLERALRAPGSLVCFPQLIQVVFCFLSVVEPAQGRGPQLADTRLVKMFAESLAPLENTEHFLLIAQAVLDATTSRYENSRGRARRVASYGRLTLLLPSCSAEKPVFVDLIPSLLRHAQQKATELEGDLRSAVHTVLKTTRKVRADALLQWVLQTRQTELLPFLELDMAGADHLLPYVGHINELKLFWTPVLREASERAELRFNCTGGIAVTMGRWPEKGFSVSAYFCFEELCSNIGLFEFVDGEKRASPLASIFIADGDTMHVVYNGKDLPLNESSALSDFSPRRWANFLIVIGPGNAMSVYLNSNKVAACMLPYFRSNSEVVVNIGLVNSAVKEAFFSIGSVVIWDAELTTPQVEAYAAITGYQPNVCKILEPEVPRELSRNTTPLPFKDRIAVFVPYENRDSLLINIRQDISEEHAIVARLVGSYVVPPKNWVDYRDIFLSRGGLYHMLDWIGQSTTAEELQSYMSLACGCIRSITNSGTMDCRTYVLLNFHLRRLAHLITPALCDSLLHLATTEVNLGRESHPFIINRLVFDHILGDVEFLALMPVDCATYLMNRVQKMFSITRCKFARRNADFIIPFRFVDSVFNGLVYANVSLPFVLLESVISCLKQIMIACDFESNIVHAFASTAALLTPVETELINQKPSSPRVRLPRARFALIRVSPSVACDITVMILRGLVECCGSDLFSAALGRVVDLQWYAACVSRFADGSCVVYATRLLFEALRCNTDLRNEVTQHPAALVTALLPHCIDEDLLLLLLSLSVGAARRIDVLSSSNSLRQQLVGILDSMTPEPDRIVAPIFFKILTLHLNLLLSTPLCFRPHCVNSLMQRRWHYPYRLRRCFCLVRVCSRLMVHIYAKRLPPRTTTTIMTPATVSFAESLLRRASSDDVLPSENVFISKHSGRHCRAWAVLRVCVRLWLRIQRGRYSRLLQLPCGDASSAAPNIEAKGTLLALDVLQRLAYKPDLFVSLTLLPYQIEAFAFLGTFLRPEEVLERAEKVHCPYGSHTAHVSARAAQAPTPVLLEGDADDWWEVVLEGHDVDMDEEEEEKEEEEDNRGNDHDHDAENDTENDDNERSRVEKKMVRAAEESREGNPAQASLAGSGRCHTQRATLGSPRLKPCEGDISTTTAPAIFPSEHNDPRDAVVLSSNNSRKEHLADVVELCDRDRRFSYMLASLFMCIAENGVEGKLRERVSALNFAPPTENLSVFNKSVLSTKAMEVLGSIIISSLFTQPDSTRWVAGKTYGSCGTLLFQMMLVTGAMTGTRDVILTLTHFFIQQFFLCAHVVEDALGIKRNDLPLSGNSTKNTSDTSHYLTVLKQNSLYDVFAFNICCFNDLLMHFIFFDVMSLSSFSSYFVALLAWASSSWPRRLQQQLRSQIVRCCVAVLNRPSVNDVTPELMEVVYTLLSRVLCPQWIMKDMLECLLRVLFRVWVSPPPTSMNEEEAARRRRLAVLALRCVMETYKGSKELCKALSVHSLTTRLSLYKDFAATLLLQDETAAVLAFDAFCHENMSMIDNFMSGRPKAKADLAFKFLLKSRSEYMTRINAFREAYSKTIGLLEQYRPVELNHAYSARFSSCVGHVSFLKPTQAHWLMTPSHSFLQTDPNVRLMRYMDSRGNYRTVTSCHRLEEGATSTLVSADQCEVQLNHISMLVQPFPIRCRPYGLDGAAPFVDPTCHLTRSALTLLRHLLDPNEVLRFVSNGFRVNGIHATPCLILLTTTAVKLISFSRITETGDIVLCKSEQEDEEEFGQLVDMTMVRSFRGKHDQQQAPFSFALSITNKLQRFLIEGAAGNRRRRREMEARQDGTKVAQSVRQASGHAYRDVFWVYPLRNVRGVRTMHYLHQDTAVLLNFIYDDALFLSLVDAQQSMHTGARDNFLSVLKNVLSSQSCEFHEHSQRTTSIRSMLIRWAAGSVSTFDYIMFLNRVAGRTRADFNQYPVYPWVIADYKSHKLALESPATYRDLSHPMGAQTEARQKAVMRLYEQMMEIRGLDEEGDSGPPFHHGTHYSTSGGVLYFLLRMEPYSTFARIFQGGELDVASRLFDSMEGSFQSCVNGPADCKELTPEFFSDGRFLLNENHYDLGEKPDGTVVNDVKLPPWAKGSTQVFTAIMRYVLESSAVVNNIHRWIDLIFGVRRRGRLAVESHNVFQRMTYGEEVLLALKASKNSHDIDVIIAEVDNFGQTPMQLFQERHPAQRELEPMDTTSSNNNNHPHHYNNSNGGGIGGSNVNSGGNGGGNGSGTCIRSGHTYTTAFQEQLPKVLFMIMHALDYPQTWYTLQEPSPGSFQALPARLWDMFCIHEKAVVDFATTRNGAKMCCYKFIAPVDNTDYLLYWSQSEHMLLRFHVASGQFLSFSRITSITGSTLSVSAFCVGCRESLILMGSNTGTVYCLSPSMENGMVLLGSTVCHHRNPIAGFAMNANYGRVVTFTTSGSDCPIVWCIQRFYLEKLHRLDTSHVLPFTTPGDRIVVAAVVDSQNANSILITRRHLIIFDRHGEPFGVGSLPVSDVMAPHLLDDAGHIGLAADGGTRFVASMTALTTYNTLEWSSGIQLLITGHQDGTLSLWRAVRLPPDRAEHGRIVAVEHHGQITGIGQTSRLGAVTTIRQERPDEPVFLVGYHSGVVKVLNFENHVAEMTKLPRS